MTTAPEPSRYQDISRTAQRVLGLGESGRYEFKRDVDVVTPKLLAALANWTALDPTRGTATLLVGVEEVEDKESGLVYGQPIGLPKGLDKAVARVQDMASKTRPVPVDVFVVEEGVATPHPFLRIEIRPTMPPHFDDEGRRQTRQGRSTRALTDDELLRVYLDRESGSFAARFRQTTSELQIAVGAMGDVVNGIAEGIQKDIARPLKELAASTQEAADAAVSASMAAESATSSADTATYEIGNVQDLVRGLQGLVAELNDETPQNVAARVIRKRRIIWWDFALDTFEDDSAEATQLAEDLHGLLSTDVSLDPARNGWELAVWDHLLAGRKKEPEGNGSRTWWTAAVAEAALFTEGPAYPSPDLPDLRTAIRTDIDTEANDPDSVSRRFQALLGTD